jgi:uncharacterized protein (DUF433 family)
VVVTETDRFTTPLYSLSEAAHYLGVPPTTFGTWAKGYVRRAPGRPEVRGAAIVTTVPGQSRGAAVIPFIGLAEGLVLAAIKESGVPLQRIRPALDRLRDEFDLEHVLASKSLYTDGAEVIYDFAEQAGDTAEARGARQLVVVRNNQRVFNEILDQYLRRIHFADDNYAQSIRLPGYDEADVVVDPRRGFGQPTFVRGGAKVEDALGLFRAGEPLSTVSREFGVPVEQLEDALRVATRLAA